MEVLMFKAIFLAVSFFLATCAQKDGRRGDANTPQALAAASTEQGTNYTLDSRMNLLPDPGFERENSWLAVDQNGSSSSAERDTTTKHGGAASLSISKTNAEGYSELTHTPVRFRKSVRHLAYAFVKGEAAGAGKAQLVLNYLDATGEVIQSTPGMAIDSVPEWQWISVRAEPPSNAATVRLAMRVTGATTLWWDDAALQVDSEGPNASPNPGFESTDTWKYANVLGSQGNFVRDTSARGFGKFTAKLQKTNTSGQSILMAREIDVTVGAPYVVSAFAKGTGTASVTLQYRDFNNKWLAVRYSSPTILGPDWQLLQLTDNPPKGARKVEILLRQETVGTSYWDEVELRSESDVLDAHNFVPNWSFEWDSDWKKVHGVSGSKGSLAYIAEAPRTGLRIAALTKTNTEGYQILYTDNLATPAARRHEGAAYVRGDASGRVRVILQYRNREGRWLKAIEGPAVIPNELWTRVSASAVPPKGASHVQVLLKLETPSTVYWDDVSLTADLKRKDIHIDVDVFDQLSAPKNNRAFRNADEIRIFFENAKARGVSRVYWRMQASGLMTYPTNVGTRFSRVPTTDAWAVPVNAAAEALERFDPLAEGVRYARENGIELFAWFDILDNGRTDLPGNSNFRSRFVTENPELQTVSREFSGIGAVNLVDNPGFEDGDAGWSALASTGAATWERDSQVARNGSHSGKLVKTTSGWLRLRGIRSPINGSSMYTASAYVRGTGGRARVSLRFRDDSGAILLDLHGRAAATGETWQLMTADGLPPAGATVVEIGLDAIDPGTYWFDDAVVNNQVHWGSLSLVYPQVRQHFKALIAEAIAYGVDGVEIMVGHSHNGIWKGPGSSMHDYRDYGFNQPIVDRFKLRHGVDLLNASTFDRDAWRRIHGEFFTDFLSELRPVLAGKKLLVGMELGQYADNTLSHQHLDWERWISSGIVDGLIVAPRFDGLNDGLRTTLEKVQPYREVTRLHGAELIYQFYINRRAPWIAASNLDERTQNPEEIARLGGMDVEAISFYELFSIDPNRWQDILSGIARPEDQKAQRLKGLSALSAARGTTATSGPTVRDDWVSSRTLTAEYGDARVTIDDTNYEDLSYKQDIKQKFWEGVGMPNHLTYQLPRATYLQELLIFTGNPYWSNKCSLRDFTVEAWNGSVWVAVMPTITNTPNYGGGKEYKVNHALRLNFAPVWTDRIRISVTKTYAPGGQLIVREIMGF
jgi:hypothetical protein